MSASSSPPLNRNLSAIFSTPTPQAGGLAINPALPGMPSVSYNIPPPSAGGGRKRKQPPGPPVDPSLSAPPPPPPPVDANAAQPQQNAPVAPVAPVSSVGAVAPATPMAPGAAPGGPGAPAPPGPPGAAAVSGQQAHQPQQAQQPHQQQTPQQAPQQHPSQQQQQQQQQPQAPAQGQQPAAPVTSPPTAKKSRTNTPWSPAEEQRLKAMRDAGNSWSEIAKTFPTRTEGSVKKHWYKDMHYAEFAEDESAALLAAIKEYETNKWKVIGQKVGKPAKACEQYAKEHFGGKT